MRNIIHRFGVPNPLNQSAVVTRLERMAQSGWMIDHMGSILWRYRAVEPQSLHFAVVWLPGASDFDPAPTEGQLTLFDLCARDGWISAVSRGQMQVFCNDAQDPPPIETDPVTQVDSIHRSMWRSYLPPQFVMLLVILWQLGMSVNRFQTDPLEFLSDPISLYMVPAWLLLLLAELWQIGSYFLWHRRAKSAAEQGVFLEPGTHQAVSLILVVCAALVMLLACLGSPSGYWAFLLWGGAILLIQLALNVLQSFLKKRGVSRESNLGARFAASFFLTLVLLATITFFVIQNGIGRRRPAGTYDSNGITIDVYHDPIPLRVEDLIPIDWTRWSTEARTSRTVLLSRDEYRQWPLTDDPAIPVLFYEIWEVRYPALYDFCREALLSEQDEWVSDTGEVVRRSLWTPTDPVPWGVREVYRRTLDGGLLNVYLLCCDDRFIVIRLHDADWTPARMRTAAEILADVDT